MKFFMHSVFIFHLFDSHGVCVLYIPKGSKSKFNQQYRQIDASILIFNGIDLCQTINTGA